MSPYQRLQAETLCNHLLEIPGLVLKKFKRLPQLGTDFLGHVLFLKKDAARPKPRQRGLANRSCFRQNPRIPDPETQIPLKPNQQVPNPEVRNSGQKFRCFFVKFPNRQLKNFQINSQVFPDWVWIIRALPYVLGHYQFSATTLHTSRSSGGHLMDWTRIIPSIVRLRCIR